MAGIFHPYYTVALAPAIGALVGIGAVVLWRHRDSLVAVGADRAHRRLHHRRSPSCCWTATPRGTRGCEYVVAVVGFASALLLVGVRHLPRRVGLVVASVALVAGLAGPAAYSLATAATPHTGSIPSAGPAAGGFGGRRFGGIAGQPPGGGMAGAPTAERHRDHPGGTTNGGASTGGLLDGSTSSTALTPAARDRRRRRTPGSRRRSAPTARPATSWPPRSR